MNNHTEKRFEIMRNWIPENKVILDVGGEYQTISDNLNYKQRLILDIKEGKGIDIVCDLNNGEIPLKENSIDVVVAGEIIEHLLVPLNFLKEINRILKDDGILILSTPNVCSLKNRLKVFIGRLPEHCAFPSENGEVKFQEHIKDFNLKQLNMLMERAGLVIEDKATNGIIFHGKTIFPSSLTKTTLGEILIVKARKNE